MHDDMKFLLQAGWRLMVVWDQSLPAFKAVAQHGERRIEKTAPEPMEAIAACMMGALGITQQRSTVAK